MKESQLNWIAGYIWGIVGNVLCDLYVRGKYRDVIMSLVKESEGLLDEIIREVTT